jgi:hypothetical protein
LPLPRRAATGDADGTITIITPYGRTLHSQVGPRAA